MSDPNRKKNFHGNTIAPGTQLSGVLRRKQERLMTELCLESLLTCPVCGHAETLTMPTDACQWFYPCPACNSLLKPKPGDCCVFCSYGSVPCPPIQAGSEDCCRNENNE